MKDARIQRFIHSPLGIAVGIAVLSVATASRAESPPNDYCRKVVERAQADAALLMGPSLVVQVLRYPASGIADATGAQVGQGVQPRVAASVGLVNFYKGLGVLDVGQADCRREIAFEELRDLLEQKEDLGRAPALERQLEVLRRHRPEVDALLTKAEARLAARISTIVEVSDLRRRALDLERKTRQVEGELSVLSRRTARAPTRPILELLAEYDARAISYESLVSHVRNLDPWRLNATGGVVTQPATDYFGVIELSYNLGGIVRSVAESRALEARQAEITRARYEVHAQVLRLLDDLRAGVAQMRGEVTALDAHLALTEATLTTLGDADAPGAPQVIALLRIESFELEADRAYLATLIEQRSALEVQRAP